ncbi:hypothetical protein P3T73_10040 [Kiritimatiellota bacterium B12222]|nr:hypothetical protein P3T73_10040 [Kiritimatiellota bacterium B12222]
MKYKRIIIPFLILFSWNAVFGAVGGLLLCIHEDLQMHSEVGLSGDADCETSTLASDFEASCLSAAETCVDVEIKAAISSLSRPDYSQFDGFINPFEYVGHLDTDLFFSLRENLFSVQPQAPPEVTAMSVHTVQMTQLRL